MRPISELVKNFTEQLSQYKWPESPSALYDPVRYILGLGGKRLRPAMVLAGYNLYKEDLDQPFEAALAVEVFHNFSLLHDDIMDDADIRRGKPSAHIKYDVNAAILSGDVMLIYVYKLLEKYQDHLGSINAVMTQTAIEVCEGQRYDMDYETTDKVTVDEYIQMITYKTAVLVACGLKMGAIVGGATEQDQFHLYNFGKNLGIAFQVQDDWLDCFGDQEQVGKKIGGDILHNKKTYLYLKSLELLSASQAERLRSLYSDKLDISGDEKIKEVIDLFKASHVSVHCDELKLVYRQLAFSHLDAVSVSDDKKLILRTFAEELMGRES
jgi:geranylgeranyl diphosphate synthase type II